MKTKTCTVCKEQKPADTKHFHKMRSGKFGLHSKCKECRSRENTGADDEIVEMSFKCKRCPKQTRVIPVHRDDIEKMSNKFYCEDCNSMVRGDDELFSDAYSAKYGDDVKASELPLMDSTGGG